MTLRRTRTKKQLTSGRTRNAVKIIERITGENADLRQMIADESLNARVAAMIYDVRTKADLTQAELAELIGTKQSVIARLEDADYEGHSLRMLQRIATAMNGKLEIFFSFDVGPNTARRTAHCATNRIPAGAT
jgi:ribosome-binding protein aMBF1 (putative translation factor)